MHEPRDVALDVDVSEPEISEPEVSEPEVFGPKASEPEASEPGGSELEASEPGASEPGASEPGASGLDSQVIWWPLRAEDEDGTTRLSRPWRAIALVASQLLLIWGVIAFGDRADGGDPRPPAARADGVSRDADVEARRVDRPTARPSARPSDRTSQEVTPPARRGADLDAEARDAPPPPDRSTTPGPAPPLESLDLLVPVVGVERDELRSTFGDPRSGGRSHLGIDIMAPRHRPVVAVAAGRIVRIVDGARSGLAIRQLSEDGHYSYFYAHLHSIADGLAEGQTVRAGQVIGTVGSTGNAATPHLHFAIRRLEVQGRAWSGEAIDPFLVLGP